MPISIENKQIIVSSPETLKEVGRVDVSTKENVEHALKVAQNYTEWSSLSLNKRCSVINKFRKIVFKNSDLVKRIIKDETGKKDFIIFAEFLSFLDHAKTMSKVAKSALKRDNRETGLLFKNKKAYVQYEPMGVVGIISPWNFSLATAMKGTIEGLLAGNNIVLKPSEFTPLTIKAIKKIWDDNIGYKDAFQIVNGAGDIGSILVESNLTDVISFTGSTKVGLQIAKICSLTLKPCILELGGKDPMIVLKDASIKRAVESALHAGLFNSGQTCISTEEVYVEDDIFDEFVSKLSIRIKDISLENIHFLINKSFKNIDLILSPAMGGIIIGYEIGRLLNKETIFCERVKGKFKLRRGFNIKKNSKILIVEDVITTGKSSLECAKLIKKFKGKLLGFACIIDRSKKKTLKIKNKKIISQIKIDIPSYNSKNIPLNLKKIPISKPGSRYLK